MADKGAMQNPINIEVAFALPQRQEIRELVVEQGCTASEAVAKSGILEKYASFLSPDSEPAMGIFSRPLNGVELPLPADYVLQENDRVEIYRPLEKDPKQARLERAARAKEEKKKG